MHLLISRSLLLAVFLQASLGFASGPPKSFSAAKRQAETIYQDNRQTFYCSCPYTTATDSKGQKKLVPDLQACGYEVRKQETRANRIEWEHVMPAWVFGHQRLCWQEGGRSNCQKDDIFRAMEADLFNLVPAVGEVNGDRSNFSFGDLSSTPNMYGNCDFKVDFKTKRAQPSEGTRGQIARTYLYMADKYGLKLSSQDQQLYNAWNNMYPVSDWEAERNTRIAKIMGWDNSFVTERHQRSKSQ